VPGSALVLALELLGDLIDDFHAARTDAGIDRGEVGRLRLEAGEGGEDLTRRDEPALLDPGQQGLYAGAGAGACVVALARHGIGLRIVGSAGSARCRGRVGFAYRFVDFVHPLLTPALAHCPRLGRRPTLPTAPRRDGRLPNLRSRDGAPSRRGGS